MAMEINGNLLDYSVKKQNYSSYTTSTVELKTSTPGVTRTEQIRTGYKNVNDYSQYLQGKYSYMNTGTTSMQGIPTTVSVSGAFLKKCMNDPDGKIAKENAKRKAQEKKAAEEKAAKRRAEKKAEEKMEACRSRQCRS